VKRIFKTRDYFEFLRTFTQAFCQTKGE